MEKSTQIVIALFSLIMVLLVGNFLAVTGNVVSPYEINFWFDKQPTSENPVGNLDNQIPKTEEEKIVKLNEPLNVRRNLFR